jgi:putative DNA primase/helicase
LPGILAWAVEGCLEWQEKGLGTAPAVDKATREYRQDEDVLGAFLEECCEMDGCVETSDLRSAYIDYIKAIGEKRLGANELGKRLKKPGIKRADYGRGNRVYEGVRLTAETA